MHKLLSGGWPSGGALFIASAVGDARLRPAVAIVVPMCEIGLAGLALSTRTWSTLRFAAPLFHVGIVVALVRAGWNSAVWPWNLALGAAAFLLFRFPTAADDQKLLRSPLVTAVAFLFLVYPLGFYAGLSEAYLAHNLYSSNTVEASLCAAGEPGSCATEPLSTWDSLNVPLPPERRLFIAWFDQICQPGEQLRIDGIWTRLSERRVEHVE